MEQAHQWGQIIILNGAPRSGKSSIAAAIQESFDGMWMNLGVDAFMKMTPQQYHPGIGLRPGGEVPRLEPLIVKLYAAMYESIAAHSRLGLNVIADVGHHDWYSQPLDIFPACAARLRGLPVLVVGVRCPLDVILERRYATGYPTTDGEGNVLEPLLRWQTAVHDPGVYDLELDSSAQSPSESVVIIRDYLDNGPAPTACARLAALANL